MRWDKKWKWVDSLNNVFVRELKCLMYYFEIIGYDKVKILVWEELNGIFFCKFIVIFIYFSLDYWGNGF